jgi:alpha-tubulin suppressor-like RCC1 family protein
MPNQFLSDEFGDIEDYFVTDYWLIDQFVGDTLFTWGENNAGQLGINLGLFQDRNTPVTTFSGGTNWKQVSAGRSHNAAIKTDGSLWTWGEGAHGRLGNNNTASRSTPITTFAGGNDWKQVSCGYNHTAAIKTDGSLWTWGRNTYGQLGNNTTADRSTPVTTFTGGNNWKSVSAGVGDLGTTAAIKTDGSLWVWGYGRHIGVNDPNDRSIPVTTFSGGNTWKQVSPGQVTVAIKTDGTLWDTRNDFFTFAQRYSGATNWKSVSSGGATQFLIAAIKTDGTLWTWGGANSAGQLGTNNTTIITTPTTTFAGGTNWKSVSVGAVNDGTGKMAAIKTDGTLWVWGFGGTGCLGNFASTNRSTPVTTFAGGNNWKQVSAGGVHMAAIKSGLNVDLS